MQSMADLQVHKIRRCDTSILLPPNLWPKAAGISHRRHVSGWQALLPVLLALSESVSKTTQRRCFCKTWRGSGILYKGQNLGRFEFLTGQANESPGYAVRARNHGVRPAACTQVGPLSEITELLTSDVLTRSGKLKTAVHDRGELAFFRVTVVKVAPLAIRLRSFGGVQWVKCAFWGGSHPQSSFEQIASMKGWELNNRYVVFQFRFSQCSQSQVLRIAKLQLRILEPLCD